MIRPQQPKRYRRLIEEIDRTHARRIMEIGTYKGGHAEEMIRAAAKHRPASEVEYYGFDLFAPPPNTEHTSRTVPPSIDYVRAKLEKTGAKIRLFKGDSRETLPALLGPAPQLGVTIPLLPIMDVIFIDGGHSDETVASDWSCAREVMGPKTVVIFDDYWNYKEGGSNATVKGIDRELFDVTLLEPVDEYQRPYGSLRTQFAKVTRRKKPPGTLTIITFMFAQPRKWRQLRFDTYRAEHVNALARACAANIRIPHRFICLTDDPAGIECETMPVWSAIYVGEEDACYRRLRAFSAEWQRELGTDFVLCMDLDVAFMGDATDIIHDAMADDFTIVRGSAWSDGTMCNWYNGSMWLCRSGARDDLWSKFDPTTFLAQRAAYKMPNGRRPHGSDQAWITVCQGANERTWGPEHGVVQYRTTRKAIPANARLVFFAGKDKPWSAAVQRTNPGVHAAWKRYA